MNLTKCRLIFLSISVGGGYLVWGLLFSLQPPFYPSEAEKKGATPSQYGFVFGCAPFTAFIFSPIFAHCASSVGSKILYNTGSFLQALAGISFGFLDYIDTTWVFLSLSYALRVIVGIADAATYVAILGILMKLFPNKVASIVSCTETLFGLGYTIAPALGSFLYSLGGFRIPFFVVGSFGIAFAICILFAVPNVTDVVATDDINPLMEGNEHDDLEDQTVSAVPRKQLSYKAIYTSPTMVLPTIDFMFYFFSMGFLESMLEPYMKNHVGASQMEVGIAFLYLGMAYMITLPIAGYACDHCSYPVILSIMGNVVMGCSLLCVGPVPFISFQPSVTTIQISTSFSGFANGLIFASCFSRTFNAAMRQNYPDDLVTYLMISGAWTTTFFFGSFVGPTLAGYLVENFGFRVTSLIFACMSLMMTIENVFEFIHRLVRDSSCISG